MKKYVLFAILVSFFSLVSVSAKSYYRDDSGNFQLCETDEGPCFSVKPGQKDVSFDLGNETITYEGENYYFDEWLQEKYEKSQIGVSRMFYYEKNEKYVLCEKKNNCRSYTFDELVKRGAKIDYQDCISFWESDDSYFEGKEYFFNSSMNEESGSVNPDNSENNSNNETNEGGETQIQKPTYTAKTDYCVRIKEPLQFIGNIVFVVKILIPVVIIIFGMIDFFKAVVGAKDDEIKKSAKSFVFRCVSGVIIFFIPTIVSLVFSLIASFADIRGDFDACQKCIFRVSECK